MTIPGGAGTLCEALSHPSRVRHTGFSHRVGVSLVYFPPALRSALTPLAHARCRLKKLKNCFYRRANATQQPLCARVHRKARAGFRRQSRQRPWSIGVGLCAIHRSAWNRNSAKLNFCVTEFSEVKLPVSASLRSPKTLRGALYCALLMAVRDSLLAR
jgi:hypothetical protein